MKCVFCMRIASSEVVAGNELAAAIADGFPVSPGHTLIVPRRCEPDFRNLTHKEQSAMWSLVDPVCGFIESTHSPDGYNIGINIGAAAGQTVAHAHLHVIPRYAGDVEDPRGGIRCILPSKAHYWKESKD
jgi:diadenosine tetraphosphate (Ap4A) HIT family hydrolase